MSKPTEGTEDLDKFLEKKDEEEGPLVKALQRELDREKRRTQDVLEGRAVYQQVLREVFEERPTKLVYPPMPGKDRRALSEEVALLHCTDLHFGKVTRTFGPQEARNRILETAEKAIRITDARKDVAKIEELHLYLGGDIVEGEDLFKGQAHEIDRGAYEQVQFAAEAIVEMVLALTGRFREVHVFGVPGNHGRVSRFASKTNNYDLMVYDRTELSLRGQEGRVRRKLARRATFTTPAPEDEFFIVDRVFRWGNLLVHGSQIKGGFAGYPWYGAAKKAMQWGSAIGHRKPWDNLYCGHFHTRVHLDLGTRQLFGTGSIESSNSYALESMGASGVPSQNLHFISPRHAPIAEHAIGLIPRTPMVDWGEEERERLRKLEDERGSRRKRTPRQVDGE